jgi:hypothetical protein
MTSGGSSAARNFRSPRSLNKTAPSNTGPEVWHSFVGGVGHPLNAKAIDIDDLTHYMENWKDCQW